MNTNTLFVSLLKFQKSVAPIFKDKVNPFHKSKYADLALVIEVVRPTLNDCDLTIIQPITTRLVDGKNINILQTKLIHSSGEMIDSEISIPDERDPQKFGSLITYYRRYAYLAILGLSAEDDDGNSNRNKGPVPAPTAQDIQDLRSSLPKAKRTEGELMEYILGDKSKKIEDMRPEDFAEAVKAVADIINKGGVKK